MASAHRQSAPDLISDLKENGFDYAFFRVVTLLLSETGQEVEERALHVQRPEHLRFSVDTGLGFPASDVVSITQRGPEDDPGYEVKVSFLGLHGSSSPLPSHFLETAAWSAGEEGVLQRFNDFFSDRLIWLLFLIWRKYRYDIRYRPGAEDQFSDWLFSFIGIGDREVRGFSHVPWAKLLPYLGIIAMRTRSAAMLAGVIRHAFTLSDVSLRELQHRRVDIPPDQLCSSGIMNCALGQNLTIGDTVEDVAGKFTVVVRDLTFARFRDFLPSGNDFRRLRELVEFLLKDQLAYDLELHLTEADTPNFLLGNPDRAQLGWTTFIGDQIAHGHQPIVLRARG
ncbi:MAG: type VI secretion system baseplate subunit TssG [Rhizobiaceae bacterium]|nr:type VI secretion system baseplate subunit TssG [Rhizobiaceae bacterium]